MFMLEERQAHHVNIIFYMDLSWREATPHEETEGERERRTFTENYT